MTYDRFLAEIIDRGIEGARQSYARPDQAELLAGSIEGFEACRGKLPLELLALLKAANDEAMRMHGEPGHWRRRGKASEIEWVCNVLSAVVQPELVRPTARGVLQAQRILGDASGAAAS